MKLLSFHGTRSGIFGLGNVLIRARLRGQYSHNEVMFEPCDGPEVAALMPDGSLEPDANGALWCCSSVGLERLPSHSRRRAGKVGGVRFKRIVPDRQRWTAEETDRDPLQAARWAREHEGSLYDWQYIVGFLAWFIPQKETRTACCEACAKMLGLAADAWRFDCCSLSAAVRWHQGGAGGDYIDTSLSRV